MLVKDLCTIETNNYNKNEKWEYFNYLDTGNLFKNNINALQFIKNEEDLPSRAKQKVYINDILYSSVRPIQEHYGFIDKEYNNLLVSTGFIILRPQKNKINPKYLYYFLTQGKITNKLQVIAQNSTSSYPSITQDDLLNLEIDLPSLETQNKITFILSTIDNQIEQNNIMVKKLQVLTQSIYSYWFNQFEFPNGEGKPYKSSGGEMVWNEELKREIPKNWSINTVKNYCNITWGQCPDGNNILPLSYNDENTILYCSGAGDMRNGIVVDCQAKTNASKRLAHKNDILMSVAGSIGAMCICDKTISLGRAAVAFTQKENQSLLTYLLINVFATRMKSVSSGSIQKVINDNHLDDIKFAFSKEIFELYTSKFNSILEVIMNLDHKSKGLIHLKEKLLPLLINGQLM